MNWLALEIHIIEGDSIWFALGGISALSGWLATGLFTNRWVRVLGGLALAVSCVYLTHYGYEAFMTWYTTPLGAHLTGIP
jgi:hypothetical protein